MQHGRAVDRSNASSIHLQIVCVCSGQTTFIASITAFKRRIQGRRVIEVIEAGVIGGSFVLSQSATFCWLLRRSHTAGKSWRCNFSERMSDTKGTLSHAECALLRRAICKCVGRAMLRRACARNMRGASHIKASWHARLRNGPIEVVTRFTVVGTRTSQRAGRMMPLLVKTCQWLFSYLISSMRPRFGTSWPSTTSITPGCPSRMATPS
jgi:hypothetical protein